MGKINITHAFKKYTLFQKSPCTIGHLGISLLKTNVSFGNKPSLNLTALLYIQ